MRPVEANIKALDMLDKAYGEGTAAQQGLKDNPALKAKVEKTKLEFGEKESTTKPELFKLTPLDEDIDNFLNQ
jgi:hypothetical protein